MHAWACTRTMGLCTNIVSAFFWSAFVLIFTCTATMCITYSPWMQSLSYCRAVACMHGHVSWQAVFSQGLPESLPSEGSNLALLH
ncbi:hypothetical protein COO60DRAFT_444478 [Scenedesmus sp. NREL 46B-D3]|nr:hypothetical protein COO60DRAFT_444478 [Scenedesmus sp. NREL 46B-D3]